MVLANVKILLICIQEKLPCFQITNQFTTGYLGNRINCFQRDLLLSVLWYWFVTNGGHNQNLSPFRRIEPLTLRNPVLNHWLSENSIVRYVVYKCQYVVYVSSIVVIVRSALPEGSYLEIGKERSGRILRSAIEQGNHLFRLNSPLWCEIAVVSELIAFRYWRQRFSI